MHSQSSRSLSGGGVNPKIVAESKQILSRHARSFRWAAQFLPAGDREAAAVVYAFCRLVDDLADEATCDDHAAEELERLDLEVRGKAPSRPLVEAFVEVADQRHIDLESAHQLIEGVLSDLGHVVVENDVELMRYCYRVAGTVGLMMCGVLGVTDPLGRPHAIDLGVAMQLTNICRDVLEDAGIGRVYLPATRLRERGTSPRAILDGTADHAAIADVVRDLLCLADAYYISADKGMHFIPARSRFAILTASRLYRDIGIRLLKRHGGDPLHGRTIVPWTRKTILVVEALSDFFRPGASARRVPHDRRLHDALRGLPGISR